MESESEIKLIFWLGTSVALLLVVGLFFLVFIYQNYFLKMKQKQYVSDLEKQILNQKLLLTQMNPHFIFNSIDNIKSLISNKKDEQAITYLTRFSHLTRQILENSTENYISLQEEISMLENYLVIQQFLYSNRFNFIIDVDSEINIENTFIPPMLTQPFIENAIRHGLKNKVKNGQVVIKFYKDESKLFFQVTDNGAGFEKNENENNHKSISVKLTKERLINYTKNNDFELITENVYDNTQQVVGAKINFEIPYIYEN